MHARIIFGAIAGASLAIAATAHALNEIVITDVFGRRLNEREITLVDWDGQIANPAISVTIQPPGDAVFPATALISSPEPRLYLDDPCDVGATGPTKTVNFSTAAAAVVRVSIFPDRDGVDEDHPLTIAFTDSNGAHISKTINVHVIDQDTGQPPLFPVTVNFGEDQTGFYTDVAKRNIVIQAAQDWAYFFADMHLDPVAVSAEETFIWNPDGFNSGHFRTNASAYTGFLLYAYGINQANPPYRSGGEPSATGGFQSTNGTPLPLRRSGGQELEIKGNFNTLGWYLTTSDADWWKAGNLGDQQNDLFSITHHEIGHALIFNPAHTRFAQFKSGGSVQDAQVLAYQGAYPAIDSVDHLNGSIDRLSRKGAFGYEYFGDVPARRWLPTKLDLLVAQAIGYTLRPTSAFAPLQINTSALPRGAMSRYYSQAITGSGGLPSYEWTVTSGALPPGLTLDSFTGIISGAPGQLGAFNFTLRLRDNDSTTTPLTRNLGITVYSTPLEITAIAPSGNNILITFRTLVSHTYLIEYTGALPAAGWFTLASGVAGTGGIVTVQDSNGLNAGHRFYRVTESP
jgi:hypothetical protein